MKKMILAAVAASAMALVAMPAAAQGWYVEGNVGLGLDGKAKVTGTVNDGSGPQTGSADIKFKKGWVLSGVVGYNIVSGLSVEAEGLMSRNKLRPLDLGDGTSIGGGYRITNAALLANVVYTAPLGMVSPYVGAGIGYGDTSLDYNAAYKDKSGDVWQVKGGAKIALSPKASVNVGVRYIDMADFKISGTVSGVTANLKAKPRETGLTVGVHYDF